MHDDTTDLNSTGADNEGLTSINPDRFKRDFDALAEIGATAEGGVHRPTFSQAHLEARAWFRRRVEACGLEFRSDGAGNHSAYLACGPKDAPTLLLGSHLDSTPSGGRFDGALGVVAALEILRCVQESGLRLPVNLEAIDFTDEEGTLVGLLGSSALAGTLSEQDLQRPRGGRQAFLEGLARAGLTEASVFRARRDASGLAGYLELHIEQGPRLLKAGAGIGVVTGMVGIASYRLCFTGRADHAGTTPAGDRLDASQGACAFTLAVRQIVLEKFAECTANVGAIRLEPGAFNIVPARAEVDLEFRSPDAREFERLEGVMLKQAHEEARRRELGIEIEMLGKHQPAAMHPKTQEVIRSSAEALGLRCMSLASGAGHDAQSLAALCPAGMVFAPSQGGASHSGREFTPWLDCVNGANVLLHAALRLSFSYHPLG